MLNKQQHFHRYYLRKKFVHSCKLPKQENIKIEEYYPKSCILTKKFLSLCLITTDVSRRRIYSKSHKVLEKERLTHLKNYKYIIHPFSDFAFYWELLMIAVFFVQIFLTPVFIILRNTMISRIYFILITQILSCFNILVSCFTGYYRTDIKEVVLDQKHIIMNSIKNGKLIIDLLGGLPIPFISYLCGASLITQRLLTCLVSFNVCPLIRYLEMLRQKRGFSFMIFRLLDAFLIFLFGICWLTVLIYVGARLDHFNQNVNVKFWWWYYNTFSFMFGTEITDFSFVGYEFLFTTLAIIFGILIRNIILVQLIIMCKTWYSSERKRERLFKELNEFCYYKRLPLTLRQRLLQYYKFKLHNMYYNETEIINQLSENLRFNIKEYTCRAWFEADIFKLCPLALRQLITIHIDEEIYFKNDVIYQVGDLYEDIYFIKSGSVLRIREKTNEMYEVPEGNFFSEKSLLPNQNAPHTSTVIAMEPCQIFKLSKLNFLKIIQNFQASYTTILDILETRKKYLFNSVRLKARLNLGDYYHTTRRNTETDEN